MVADFFMKKSGIHISHCRLTFQVINFHGKKFNYYVIIIIMLSLINDQQLKKNLNFTL